MSWQRKTLLPNLGQRCDMEPAVWVLHHLQTHMLIFSADPSSIYKAKRIFTHLFRTKLGRRVLQHLPSLRH